MTVNKPISAKTMQAIAAFIPSHIATQLATGDNPPPGSDAGSMGVALFVDIAGFTPPHRATGSTDGPNPAGRKLSGGRRTKPHHQPNLHRHHPPHSRRRRSRHPLQRRRPGRLLSRPQPRRPHRGDTSRPALRRRYASGPHPPQPTDRRRPHLQPQHQNWGGLRANADHLSGPGGNLPRSGAGRPGPGSGHRRRTSRRPGPNHLAPQLQTLAQHPAHPAGQRRLRPAAGPAATPNQPPTNP
jgi:hypothetical protein